MSVIGNIAFPPTSRLERVAPALTIAILALCVACLFVIPVLTIGLHVPKDYNEGWNAYFAARAMSGEELYPARSAFIFNNYPPLSFYVVGALGSALGDHIVAGRIIALLSLAVVALNAGIATHRLGALKSEAVLASLLFLLFVGTNFQSYVAMDDPQWLSHAFQTTGLVILVGDNGSPRTWRRLVAAFVLMLLGGLVKHNSLALPLAATAWLALYERRNLILWLALGVAAVVIVMTGLTLVFPNFMESVLGHARRISLSRLVSGSLMLGAPLIPLMVIAILQALLSREKQRAVLVTLYFCFSAILGFFSLSGDGVDYNALFDTLIASTIAAALFAGWLISAFRQNLGDVSVARVTAIALLAAPILTTLPGSLKFQKALLENYLHRDEWQGAVTAISRMDGPVACELSAICYWAEKPFEIDFFNLGQSFFMGRDPNELENLIRAHHYAAIQLGDTGQIVGSPTRTERMPDSINAAIGNSYQVAAREPTTILVPAGSKGPAAQ